MKLLGVVFALVLLFLPLSVTLEAQVDSKETPVAEDQNSKNPVTFFRKKIIERLEKIEVDQQPEEIKGDSSIKSKIGIFQKRLEDILKKLNNTR